MKIITSKNEITPTIIKGIQHIFKDEYWTKTRTLEDIKHLIHYTSGFIVILKDEKVVAFGRYLTDYKFVFTIYDVIVDPEERGSGYGKYVTKHLISVAKEYNPQFIELLCLDKNIPFYKRFGFKLTDDLNVMRM